MQKPKRGRSLLAIFHAINMLKVSDNNVCVFLYTEASTKHSLNFITTQNTTTSKVTANANSRIPRNDEATLF